MKIMC